MASGDRFIPARGSGSLDLDLSHFKLLHQTPSASTPGRKENTHPSHPNAATPPVVTTTVADDTTPAREEYKALLERTLLGSEGSISSRLLPLSPSGTSCPASPSALASSGSAQRLMHIEQERVSALRHASSPSSPLSRRHAARRLPSSAERVLDAPDILDDYYCVSGLLPAH